MQMSEQVRDVLRKMQADYVANLPRKLDAMEELVMELQSGNDYEHSFENLYRAVHSLKGTAGTYGIPVISTICQPFEDYLISASTEGTGCRDRQVSDCLSYMDLLKYATSRLAAGNQQFPEIEASLATL